MEEGLETLKEIETQGSLFDQYAYELEQLKAETLSFKRSYVCPRQIDSHPPQWQLHLAKLHSSEKRFELLRYDHFSRLQSYPQEFHLTVSSALSSFLFAHVVPIIQAFLDSAGKGMSWNDSKVSELSDSLSNLRVRDKERQTGISTERIGLEMKLSVFDKHPQLRPGGLHIGRKSGYLWKHGNLLKEWKRRFFFTKNHSLWYYRDNAEIRYADLSLSKASEHKSSDNVFSIELKSAKTAFELLAESQPEMKEWIYALNSLAEESLLGSEDSEFRCADCAGKNAQWCSLNLGVILCNECSGVHRSLGSHISKVRSLKMDNIGTVTREVIQLLHQRQEEIWGAIGQVSVFAGFPEREAFVKRKYEEKVGLTALPDPVSALKTAIATQDLVLAARAIHSGAGLFSIFQTKGQGFLHAAVQSHSLQMFEFLLLSGADLNSRDGSGLTVLDAALLTQQPELVTYVLNSLDNK